VEKGEIMVKTERHFEKQIQEERENRKKLKCPGSKVRGRVGGQAKGEHA